MKSVVIYATRSGNTRRVAQAIAGALNKTSEVDVFPIESAPTTFDDADLLVVGGPTEGHGMTPTMKAFLGELSAAGVANIALAAFDTRLSWPVILSGSAAAGIADRLRELGGELIVPPESFIVDRTPELKPGEFERAGRWGSDVATLAADRPGAQAAVPA